MPGKQVVGPVMPVVDNSPISKNRMIPEILEKGTMMKKISAGKEKKVLVQIDPDQGTIKIRKSTDNNLRIIPIEAIKELRVGANTDYYRLQFKKRGEFRDRWITIIYILDGEYKTLHLVPDTADICKLYKDAIEKLLAIRQGLMEMSVNSEVRQDVWERQYFKGADVQGDQVLDFDDVKRLCLRLNVNLTNQELVRLFKEADTESRGYLDYPQFQTFVRILQRRPDIEEIYEKLCTTNGGQLSLEGFATFMKDSQKSSLGESEIKAIFEKFAGSSTESKPLMSLAAFSAFLVSPENAAFSELGKGIWQDMSQPISHYFISSSHNTYLIGHQLVGVSTIEGYIRALLHSCRSVELDIYDGDVEPVVYHGKTLTSEVPLRDICNALAKYAFQTSPYPVIISAEVHCSLKQQEKLVDVMIDVFKDSMVQVPVEGRSKIEHLPSPEELKYKFLLKAKNLYLTQESGKIQATPLPGSVGKRESLTIEAETTSSSSDSEMESMIKEGLNDIKSTWNKLRGKGDGNPPAHTHRTKMSCRLASLLVYTVGIKCRGLNPNVEYAPEHIFSLSENTANKLVKDNMVDLVKHTHTHLVRVYPKGTRVDSTNYLPHHYWASGCQVVAINWQTFDLGYIINQVMFHRNGRSGYVLKPDPLRHPENLEHLYKRTRHFFEITIISAQQLPRLRDSDGREIIEKSIVDPFVEVSLHIPEWSVSPFLSDGATTGSAKPPTATSSTSTVSARTVSFRTAVVKDNGFNPIWRKEICIPFDCVGDMKDLIFVGIAVHQENKGLIGVHCTSLGCLEQGYRHLPLYDAQLSQLLFSTLFVKVNIRDVDS